jgi:hypothetical protein
MTRSLGATATNFKSLSINSLVSAGSVFGCVAGATSAKASANARAGSAARMNGPPGGYRSDDTGGRTDFAARGTPIKDTIRTRQKAKSF